MIIIKVLQFDAGAKEYKRVSETHSAPDLGIVMGLFTDSGKEGMDYQYLVSDGNRGEPMVTYYANQPDLASKLPTVS
ncbi:MAG: hypothetical protein OEY67_06800 [Gammaproteobacteria bacterium]|nr:hypothetical protein [Gammaproteobacteria bacterium]